MKLYEISEAYNETLEAIINGEADVEALNEISDEWSKKVTNIGMMILQCKALAEDIKERESALAQRRKSYENTVDRLKMLLTENFRKVGQDRFENGDLRISFKPSKAVEIVDEDQIPEDYFTEKVTRTVSKTAIRAAMDAGETVPGAVLVTNDNIQIK